MQLCLTLLKELSNYVIVLLLSCLCNVSNVQNTTGKFGMDTSARVKSVTFIVEALTSSCTLALISKFIFQS